MQVDKWLLKELDFINSYFNIFENKCINKRVEKSNNLLRIDNYTDIENLTSAYDLNLIWKHLYNGTFLNKDNGQMLIDILRRQQIKNKLALYLCDDLKYEISSKTGDKYGVENDTEFIQLPKGDFAFTVLSSGLPNSVYGTVTLAKCGKMMWDEIANNWH